MQTLQYQSLKINESQQYNIHDDIVVEAPLQININNEPYSIVMRTPNDDMELIRGLLFAEDIYKNKSPLDFQIIKTQDEIPTIININLCKKDLGKGYINKRTLLSVSSCGICGKKELSSLAVSGTPLTTEHASFAQSIHEMHFTMKTYQGLFKATGGSHAAAIFTYKQELLSLKEDIGRHNAVDKTVGDLLEKNTLDKAKYLLVSGRVSYEIVSKAFLAKIPIIVAISACSSLAIDFAKEFGICLIGFTRNQKMTIYANPHYINDVKHA